MNLKEKWHKSFGVVRHVADGAIWALGMITLNLGLTFWAFEAFPGVFSNPAYDTLREERWMLLLFAYGFMLCGAVMQLGLAHRACCFRAVACVAASLLYVVLIACVFWPDSATAIVVYGTISVTLFSIGVTEIVDDIGGLAPWTSR